jgi:HK97 family phage portal protein
MAPVQSGVMPLSWLTRSLRPPPEPEVPNSNDPAAVPPSTVGPDQLMTPGDPHGVVVEEGPPAPPFIPLVGPAPWSGWPESWSTPSWNGHLQKLTDTAWVCVDLNSSILSTMPPYLVGAAPSIDASWLLNPDPDLTSSWDEFAKQLFWDYQAAGEAFVYVTARYSSGWPARFHCLPPWSVEVELGRDGMREYKIGDIPVNGSPGGDLLHIRYQSTVDDARGHGPLEAGSTALVAANVLARYGATVISAIPPAVLEHPEKLAPDQAAKLKADWIAARQSGIGEPAVLTGGIKWTPASMTPRDMALVELSQLNEARVAVMLGVPPAILGLPTGDSMTYANVTTFADHHWRMGLRPKADAVTSALSEFLLPRGTTLELNKDAYVEPEPLQRAQTAQIYAGIRDEQTGQTALSVEEIREAEHFTGGAPIAEVIR